MIFDAEIYHGRATAELLVYEEQHSKRRNDEEAGMLHDGPAPRCLEPEDHLMAPRGSWNATAVARLSLFEARADAGQLSFS